MVGAEYGEVLTAECCIIVPVLTDQNYNLSQHDAASRSMLLFTLWVTLCKLASGVHVRTWLP